MVLSTPNLSLVFGLGYSFSSPSSALSTAFIWYWAWQEGPHLTYGTLAAYLYHKQVEFYLLRLPS